MSHFSKEIHDSGYIKKVSTILVLDKAILIKCQENLKKGNIIDFFKDKLLKKVA
jgi:hypothetical protein